MSNFYFPSPATPAPELAAKRAAFLALPADEQQRIIATFEALRAKAAAVKAMRAELAAVHAIDAARASSAQQ